uniref:Lissencephaly-1 homolog n=1 Tax=Globodera rostochiensis TaxID=31243 RepID=A0A914I824_GLORO
MVMSSSKQRDDINLAIVDYLESHGHAQSASIFRQEANVDENADPARKAQLSGMLEKKWVLTTRLQAKVLNLEEQLKQRDREVAFSGPSREKRVPDEWIPRPPELFQLTGHRMPVTKVVFHPQFNLIASSSEDCTIKIWEFESGEFERTLKGHTDTVQDINFNSSGKLLASCSADMTIKIWDFVNTYECLKTLKGHEHNISSVAFLPSGDFVLSASRDKLIKLWDIANGYCVQNFSKHTDWVRTVAVNEDGTCFASCSNDRSIIVWCLATKMPKMTLLGHEHVIETIIWVPDKFTAQILAFSDDSSREGKTNGDIEQPQQQQQQQKMSMLISASRDRTIRFWEVLSGCCVCYLTGHDNWVRAIRLHPNGKQLVSVSDDKTLRVWSIEHRRCIKTLQAHPQFVTSLDFHSKLAFVVTGSVDTTVKLSHIVISIGHYSFLFPLFVAVQDSQHFSLLFPYF